VGQVIHFEEHAVARLRERLGVAEEANEDLIAFARGHSGAVASIHAAALVAIEAGSIEDLLAIVTNDWPAILGIDAAAIALVVGSDGFRATSDGIERVEPAWVSRVVATLPRVDVRSVGHGHPLFGAALAGDIRAEALIRIDSPPPYPWGLLALGQQADLDIGSGHGSELLLFLGEILAAAVRRFVAAA